MSDRYPFAGDTTFTHNGPLVWNDQASVQSTLDFSHVSDTTLTDSINDSYATAVEDNETQYLSVLETSNDITLEAIHNLNLENNKMAIQEHLQFGNSNTIESVDVNGGEINDQQVIVFSMDGSDDLYGIQFAQDEEGHMQKYQFKFRTTEDGQLEAIPESIQLLVNDMDMQAKNEDDTIVQEVIRNDEEEGTDEQIIYQEDPGLQQTSIFEKPEDVSTKDFGCHSVQTEECSSVQMFIKGELEILEDRGNDDGNDEVYISESLREEAVMEDQEIPYGESETEDDFEENFVEEENVDVKMGILDENSVPVNIKQEIFQEDSQDTTNIDPPEEPRYEIYNHHHVDIKSFPYQNGSNEEVITEEDIGHHIEDNIEADKDYIEVEEAHETVLEYEHYVPEEIQDVCEETNISDSPNLPETSHDNSHYERVFIKESSFHRLSDMKQSQAVHKEKPDQEPYYTETGTENDSDNDDYQIVEGLHVTGDVDEDSSCAPYQDCDIIHQELPKKTPVVEHANILKQPSLIKSTKEHRTKNKTFVYYVVPHVEKENVNSLSMNYTSSGMATYRPIRSNPRSILKSSFPETREKPDIKALMDERFNKRFARSKEAVQARLFNNFISKTTIPHAPIRQTRLPRKQQIKPVDNRRDEEIIVQEVMVGSNGFIENLEEKLKNKDKLEITQYVILSDSDEEYDPKKGSKKRKKPIKQKSDIMANAEDSDSSIIEIRSDEEETCINQHENFKRARGRPKKFTDFTDSMDNIKRRRGRPPKSNIIQSNVEEMTQTVSVKPVEVETDITKKEFKCPHCIKTFPSQNSLSTHIHHHSLENSLRNRDKDNSPVKYKHKCDTCLSIFKNSILLNRHVCPKQERKMSKRLMCTICYKSFPELSALNIHKRLHIKEKLVSTTALTKVSPKKIILRPSTDKKLIFKCKDCSRTCLSQESLNLHEKTHKKFICDTCGTTFSSRLLLDTHIRVNCVKNSKNSPLAKNKRLSFKIRKSFLPSPKRNLTKKMSSNSFSKTVLNNPLGLKLKCDQCGEKFTMFQELFEHQVKTHGLETPDKSILKEQKKQLHKPKTVHGGIPARDGMKKVFEDIRSKIALMTPKKDSG